jgi:hypothetical protein
MDEHRQYLNARFEHAVMLQELLEDFLGHQETRSDEVPTIYDFAEWLTVETERMAGVLGIELDEDTEAQP